MYFSKLIVFVVLFVAVPLFISAQGCSDAGFCSLKYGSNTKSSIAVGHIIGSGDGATVTNTTYVQFNTKISENAWWDTKLNTNHASGSLGNNFGLGDVITNISYKAYNKHDISLHFVAGAKFPLGTANAKVGSASLPMAYQSTLGTVDALFGGSIKKAKWEFTQAWQIPLTKANKNSYNPAFPNVDFPSSNELERRSDALLRVAYTLRKAKSKLSIKPNVLAIYHLGEDKFTNAAGNKQNLVGSDGLTVNLSAITQYIIGKNQVLELGLATPIKVRTIRPDGLTRSFTAGIEYKISF
jgi:hypothetical protein